eukprot:Unigene3013_Nuclearia_a/m.9270 Unigene3013_Nuclearia_a/g.9270  ORF Unigene3013_Nuclearia_a/g.9270 Unigene3013_Nuclearia_a/m.9270 type:complete len:237 (+) Unigene3013_Nuclearia_a:127-837(+)
MASMENVAPVVLKHVAKELLSLHSEPPEDIKVLPNDDDMTDIQAVITGPAGTPYEGGQFKVKLVLSEDFPNTPPKGYFVTKIFHPNVSKVGEICVSTLKKDWKKDLGIKHILLTIKCLLIAPNPESALNEEAGKLLLERYEDYAKHARLMTSIHAMPRSGLGSADPSNIDTAAASNGAGAAAAGAAAGNGEGDGEDGGSAGSGEATGAAAAKKRAVDKAADEKKKAADKKRSLKRL